MSRSSDYSMSSGSRSPALGSHRRRRKRNTKTRKHSSCSDSKYSTRSHSRRRSYSRKRYSRSRSRRRSRSRDRRGRGRYRSSRRRSRDRFLSRSPPRRQRRRRRSISPDPFHKPLNRFRHPSLSLPKTQLEEFESSLPLEDPEVAYIFGRMGTTKDKLARVSGTKIELVGNKLIFTGSERCVDRAKKYSKILLAQRNGVVQLNPADHPDDLTLVSVPLDCKGFVTGKRGATLRQIERQCATLMTFCSTGKDEPLAIFGTRRGRLMAQLKIMSIVESKSSGWFCKSKEEPPKLEMNKYDKDDGDWGIRWMKIDLSMVGYVLGKRGETRQKLEIASGCIIQYVNLWVAFAGKEKDQKRGKKYLKWLLQQREEDVRVDVRGREDCKILWVPEASVGYVTGVKAATLRNLESKTGTFCYFDKKSLRNGREKILIFSHNEEHRNAAAEEIYLIVDFHQRKVRGSGKCYEYHSDSDDDAKYHSESDDAKEKSCSRSRSPLRT